MHRRLASLLLVLFLLLLAPAGLRAEPLNRIVLRVNDQIATLYDFQERREDMTREVLRRQQDPEERQQLLAQLEEVVFADLFQELLLESRAQQLGVQVTDVQVDTAIQQVRQNFGIETDEQFAAALAQSGMTLPQLQDQMRKNLRLQEVRSREVSSRVNVDEQMLRRYYQAHREELREPAQVRLREVVVLDEGGLPAAERERLAQEIRREVASGRSLDEVVAEHAEAGHASGVIELGWVVPGDLDPALERAVWDLQPGQVSEAIPARGGLHVAVVTERKEARVPPFNEVSARIEALERDRVFREEVARYMAELETSSLVMADPPPAAAGFRKHLGEPTSEEQEIRDLGTAGRVTAEPPVAEPPSAEPPI